MVTKGFNPCVSPPLLTRKALVPNAAAPDGAAVSVTVTLVTEAPVVLAVGVVPENHVKVPENGKLKVLPVVPPPRPVRLIEPFFINPLVAPSGVKVEDPPTHITVGVATIEKFGAGVTVTVIGVRRVDVPQLVSAT